MDAEKVVQGVIDSIDALGPTPPSARTLAKQLNVAPATLYSSITSMADAYAAARSSMVEEIVDPLTKAISGAGAAPLATALFDNPNRAVFITQPTWSLPDTPTLSQAWGDAGLDMGQVLDGLAVIGSQFTLGSLCDGSVSVDDIEEAIVEYRSAEAADGTPESVDLAPVVEAAHAVVRGRSLPPDVEKAQHASVDLIVCEPEGWSFRAMGERTGIPISRLHRFGSRVDHMLAALAAFGHAMTEWVDRMNLTTTEVWAYKFAILMNSYALGPLGELYETHRVDPDAVAPSPRWLAFDQLAPLPALAALICGQFRGASAGATIARSVALAMYYLETTEPDSAPSAACA